MDYALGSGFLRRQRPGVRRPFQRGRNGPESPGDTGTVWMGGGGGGGGYALLPKAQGPWIMTEAGEAKWPVRP